MVDTGTPRFWTRTARLTAVVASCLVLLVAACGDDDDGGSASPATEASGGADTTASPATEDSGGADTTAAPDDGADGDDASGGDGLPDCPDAADVSTALGVELMVDAEAVSAGGFCAYTSADGSGDVSGSITFTPIDITADDSGEREAVPGLGERAFWSDGADELVVWTGDLGLIVAFIDFTGGGADSKDAAVAVARLAGG